MITAPASILTNPTADTFAPFIRQHLQQLPGLNRLRNYYLNHPPILSRIRPPGLPNNRIAYPFASYIVDVSSSYLLGEPVRYESNTNPAAIDALRDTYALAQADSVDIDLAINQSLYGRAISLAFIGPSGAPRIASLDPRFAFIIHDDTVLHTPLCGVLLTGSEGSSPFTVYFSTHATTFTPKDRRSVPPKKPHPFQSVPMTEYKNNSFYRSDIAPILSLIDAYNTLGSDRLNDREQFTDALLVITGLLGLGADPQEEAAAFARLRQERVLSLPDSDASAKWLTKPSSERDIEALRKALADDIHKLSQTPDFSDDHFGGNTSGIAIKYKLFNFDTRTRLKERFFLDGLRERAALLANWLQFSRGLSIDLATLRIKLTRRLPVDELDRAKALSHLAGIVPDEVITDNAPLLIDEHN